MRRIFWGALVGIVLACLTACAPIFQDYPPAGMINSGSLRADAPDQCLSFPPHSNPAGRADVPDWWQVYFTDPAGHGNPQVMQGSIEEKIIAYIRCSQHSIDIASYDFDLPRVAGALQQAEERGVKIRWITDVENGIQPDANGLRLFPGMMAKGIQVKSSQLKGLMHDKFWIFDRESVWTGSTNITRAGIYQNNNNVIVIHSARLADIYERQFEDMWKDVIGPYAPSDIGSQFVLIENTPIQVLFSPEDHAMTEILQTVQSAQKSIHFMALTFTDNNLAKTMIDRSKHGLQVSGIFEKDGSEQEPGQLHNLFCAHLPVMQDGNPSLFHHKVIIVDDTIVITGSFNFTNAANRVNSENILIINNPLIASAYLTEFNQRWGEASKPDPQKIKCP